MIQTVDPFLATYELKQAEDKGFSYSMVPMNKSDVEAADYLIRISQGRTNVVTASDWGVVAKVFEFWTRKWPEEWQEFRSNITDIKATRARKDGYSKEKGRSGVRYLGALPPRFARLMKAVFPEQQWDRKFVSKFIDNIKIVRVGDKVNSWFTIPEAPLKRETTHEIVEKAVSKINKGGKIKHGNTR